MNIEDKFAIQQLVIRCMLHNDRLETDLWVDVFSPDVIFDDREFGFGIHEGHEELRAFGRSFENSVTHMVHLISNHLITGVTETSATGTCFSLAESMGAFGHVRRHVSYDDEYVKLDGEWKIRKRVLHQTFPPEVLSGPTEPA